MFRYTCCIRLAAIRTVSATASSAWCYGVTKAHKVFGIPKGSIVAMGRLLLARIMSWGRKGALHL